MLRFRSPAERAPTTRFSSRRASFRRQAVTARYNEVSTLRARDLRRPLDPHMRRFRLSLAFSLPDSAPSLPLALALPDLLPSALWSLTDHLGSFSALAIGSGRRNRRENLQTPVRPHHFDFFIRSFRVDSAGSSSTIYTLHCLPLPSAFVV